MRKYFGFQASRLDVFQIVSTTLLAATFVVVPVETGPVISDGLNLTGKWAAIGYVVAVVFDLVWLAALSRVPAAVRQRSRAALAAALGVALAGSALSVTGVLVFGTMPALAAVPVVALAVHALGQVFGATLADVATDGRIADMQRADRNRRAESAQGARSMGLTRSLAADARVSALLAEQDDADAVEAALTARLAAREVRRTTQAAQLEAQLSTVTKAHGDAAAAFRSRGLADAALAGAERPKLRLIKGDAGAFDPVDAAWNAPDADATDTDNTAGHATDTDGRGAIRPPALTDAELTDAGRKVWASMGRPRRQAEFIAAVRAAGHSATTARLRALYNELSADAVADAADVIGADVTADEITD